MGIYSVLLLAGVTSRIEGARDLKKAVIGGYMFH